MRDQVLDKWDAVLEYYDRLQRWSVRYVPLLALFAVGCIALGAGQTMQALNTQTKSGPARGNWAAGQSMGINTDYLNWVSKQINPAAHPGERFLLVAPKKANPTLGDMALRGWASFQLYPVVATEDRRKARWVLLYETPPNQRPDLRAQFPSVKSYGQGFALLEAKNGS